MTQEALLVLHSASAIDTDVRVSKEALLVLHDSGFQPETRLTQEALLVLHSAPTTDTEARMSQEALLVLHSAPTTDTDVRVSQEALLVLHENNYSTPVSLDVQISQAPLQVLLTDLNSDPLVKVSQAPLQVLLKDLSSKPEVKISQAPLQVLVTDISDINEVLISQAPVQVILNDLGYTPELRVSQAPLQILVKAIPLPGILCFVVCFEDGTYPEDTVDYVMLLGADIATATFMEAGTVYHDGANGACISPASGEMYDDIILVLQYGDMIGAYEGILQ